MYLGGGAATVTQSSDHNTLDLDGAAPSSLIKHIQEGVTKGTNSFSLESDDKKASDGSSGFRLYIDLLGSGSFSFSLGITAPYCML